MGAKATGGPAFPHKEYSGMTASGATLHDYFMAHAPEQPQSWFIPEMPACPVVPSIRSVSHTPFRVDLLVQEDFAAEDQSHEARKWFAAREEAEDAQAAWQAEFRKQLCIQWPSAWADAMLEKRKC